MRRREINPEFWTDERVVRLSDAAKLAFIGLWQIADRSGRLEDRALAIGFKIRPWSAMEMPGLLTELAATGLIVRYTVNGKALISIPNMPEHQRFHPNEMKTKLPPPPQRITKVILEEYQGDPRVLPSGDISPGSAGSAGSSGPSGSSGPAGSSGNNNLVEHAFDGSAAVQQQPTDRPQPSLKLVDDIIANAVADANHFALKPTVAVESSGKVPAAKPKRRGAASLTADELDVFEHWRATCGHPRAVATPERKSLIARQLRFYSVEQLQNAIDGCSKTPWNQGQNPKGERYDSLELILRDAKHIETFAAKVRA